MEKPQHKPQLDYHFIADGIYVGTNQCCTTHLDEMLLREGITVDISLESERLDQPFGVEAYLWLPTKDHMPPSPAQLDMGVVLIERAVALGKKIYIHCKNGHGRAPTLAAAYFISMGKTPDEAITLLKTQRTSVHFQEPQIEALRNFAK